METIILIFIATSLFTWGLNAITREGQLFYPVQKVLLPILGEHWTKPVVNCPLCMPSLWGTISFALMFIFIPLPTWAILLWPVWCICLSGFNKLIDKFAPY